MRYGRHLLAATVGASLMFSGLAIGVVSVVPTAQAQEVETGAGTMATVDVDFLNVRQTPSLTGAVVTTLAYGDAVEIVTGPVAADGYDWYRIRQDGALLGWSVAGFLQADAGETGTPVAGWSYGDIVTINTDLLNVRETPSTSAAVLDVYELGFEAVITGDAKTADGILWYPVDNLGWVAGQYLSNGDGIDDSDPGTTPVGDWVYGDGVIVNTDLLNVRESPTIDAAVLKVYEFGTEATITGDAVTAGGVTWFPVDNLGWVSGAFLADGGASDPADGSGDASGEFFYGDIVLVNTDLLNVRSLPTMTGDVLDVYPQGTEATITGDATPVDGVVWYPVDNLGWVAGQYLTLVSAAPGTPAGSTSPAGSVAPGTSAASSGSAAPSTTASPSASGSTSPTASTSARPSGSTSAAPSTSARPSSSTSATPSTASSARASASTSSRPSVSAVPSSSASPSSAAGEANFADGDVVSVNTARLNIRAEALDTGEVLRTVDFGTEFTIVGDPVTVDGTDWYNVGTAADGEWVVGDFLALADE